MDVLSVIYVTFCAERMKRHLQIYWYRREFVSWYTRLMKAVIFDFDGTIGNSLPGVIELFERFNNREPLTAKERSDLQHKSILNVALKMQIPKWRIATLAFTGRRLFAQHTDAVQPHPGMDDLIARLYSLDVSLYILSVNRTDNVRSCIRRYGLEKCFSGIFGGANSFSKTRALRRLVKREGLDIGHTWYVGDQEVDVVSAQRAGLPVIAVDWGYAAADTLRLANPDYLVSDVYQLEEALNTCFQK